MGSPLIVSIESPQLIVHELMSWIVGSGVNGS